MSLSALHVAEKIEKNRTEVLNAIRKATMGIVGNDPLIHHEMVGQIIRRKHYLRYIDAIRDLGPLGLKLCIIAIYEAIDEPDMAIREIENYMHS